MTTINELLTHVREDLNTKIELHNQYVSDLEELRSQDAPDRDKVDELLSRKTRNADKITELRSRYDALLNDKKIDDEATRAAEISVPTDVHVAPASAQRTQDGAGHRAGPRAGDWIDTRTGETASVRRGESFAGHPVVMRGRRAGDDSAVAQYGDLGQMLRALTTSGGSAVVPTVWAAELIDKARNASAVMAAGATIVPMDAGTVKVGRLTGDPTAAFRSEGSTITASDPVLDNVTLTAKTQSTLVIGSLEWFQDADNAETLVSDAIANAIALHTDLAALYGGITSGAGDIDLATPPNPRGILAALNATLSDNVLGGETNGTTQTTGSFWDEILDTIYKVRDGNEEPNAMIWNTKLARTYAKANDNTGQPLQRPADVEAIQRYSSNQIPSYTQGTLTTATDLFVGDFTQLLIGQRLGITLQVLTERYAENGQIGIVAHWRGDVQPARSSAFAVYQALKGA